MTIILTRKKIVSKTTIFISYISYEMLQIFAPWFFATHHNSMHGLLCQYITAVK